MNTTNMPPADDGDAAEHSGTSAGPGAQEPSAGTGHAAPPPGTGYSAHGRPPPSSAYAGPPPSGAHAGPPPAGAYAGPTWQQPPRREASAGFFDSLRRTGIWRGQDRWVGGVATGVARRLDVDPLLVRGVLIVATLFGGLGLLLYGLAWALLPEESDGRIHLQEALRGNVDAALAGALAFAVIGLSRPGTWWSGWGHWAGGFFFSVLSLGVGALIVVGIIALVRRGSAPTGPRTGEPQAPGGTSGPPAGGASGPPTWRHEPGDVPPPPGAWTPAGAPPPPTAGYGPSADAATGATPATDYPAYATAAYPAATATYPTASYGSYPAGGAPTVHPPPAPPRPRTAGPGQAMVAVVLGLCLLVTAALLLWNRAEPIGWLLPLTIGGAVLTVLGLGVLLAGARGRRGGVLSALGILLALVVVPGTVAASVAPADLGLSPGARLGDLVVAPTTAADAEDGYELLAGDLELDLRGLDGLDGAGAITIPVDVAAGTIDVRVDAGTAVRIEVELAAGRVESSTQPGWSADTRPATGPSGTDPTGSRSWVTWASGTGIDTTLLSPAAQEDGADIIVQIRAGAGDVYIEEEA